MLTFVIRLGIIIQFACLFFASVGIAAYVTLFPLSPLPFTPDVAIFLLLFCATPIGFWGILLLLLLFPERSRFLHRISGATITVSGVLIFCGIVRQTVIMLLGNAQCSWSGIVLGGVASLMLFFCGMSMARSHRLTFDTLLDELLESASHPSIGDGGAVVFLTVFVGVPLIVATALFTIIAFIVVFSIQLLLLIMRGSVITAAYVSLLLILTPHLLFDAGVSFLRRHALHEWLSERLTIVIFGTVLTVIGILMQLLS